MTDFSFCFGFGYSCSWNYSLDCVFFVVVDFDLVEHASGAASWMETWSMKVTSYVVAVGMVILNWSRVECMYSLLVLVFLHHNLLSVMADFGIWVEEALVVLVVVRSGKVVGHI